MLLDSHLPAPFFVLRTPLLPLSDFLGWNEGSGEPVGRCQLRERLRAVLQRPEVREALYHASPTLSERMPIWAAAATTDTLERVESSLVAYFARISSRPTPFGLCATYSIGRVSNRTVLELAPRGSGLVRHVDLDLRCHAHIRAAVEADDDLRSRLLYRTNPTLYRVGEAWHYVNAVTTGDGADASGLERIAATPYLDAAIEAARTPRRLSDIAAAILDTVPTPERTADDTLDALAFAAELVATNVLQNQLAPRVVGDSTLRHFSRSLCEVAAGHDAAVAATTLNDAIERLGGECALVSPHDYDSIGTIVTRLGATADHATLLRVNTRRQADAHIDTGVVRVVGQGIDCLHRITAPAVKTGIQRFIDDFQERYGDQEVRLVDALDEEIGVGFEPDRQPPWVGVQAPQPRPERTRSNAARESLLESIALTAAANSTIEVALSEQDVERLTVAHGLPLPRALSALFTVAAPSAQAIEAGDFRVVMHSVVGPSGARLLGRFCQADQQLESLVRDHLRLEEQTDPTAIFAEIVYAPPGGGANVVTRSLLRSYCIEIHGGSDVGPERTLSLDDLLVGIRDGRVVLRSKSLQRRVHPRLTCAHNFIGARLPIYRFLASIQEQRSLSALQWNWGSLEQWPFLPRISVGRVVLSRARWRVARCELDASLAARASVELMTTIGRWRERRVMPRFVALADGDRELLTDLENVLSVESLLRHVHQKSVVTLREIYPPPDRLCATGTDGAYTHEIVLPFVQRVSSPTPTSATNVRLARAWLPGGRWCYAALYATPTAIDRMLCALERVFRAPRWSALIARWFFVRYEEPAWHLRLRLLTRGRQSLDDVRRQLEQFSHEARDRGWLGRMQFDSYVPEVVRYGGSRGLVLSERLFHADSVCATKIVAALTGQARRDRIWQSVAAGVDALLADFRLPIKARHQFVLNLRNGYDARLQPSARMKADIGGLYKAQRATYLGLSELAAASDETTQTISGALRQRSAATQRAVATLRGLADRGELTQPLNSIVASHVHMHVNRMLRTPTSQLEWTVYCLLAKWYAERLHRDQA